MDPGGGGRIGDLNSERSVQFGIYHYTSQRENIQIAYFSVVIRKMSLFHNLVTSITSDLVLIIYQ